MITVGRWVLVAVLTIHGRLHLLGVVKGFGWAQVAQLTHPVGAAAGSLWLIAALTVLACAAFLAAGAGTWWWALALFAAAVSQAAVVTSWDDARAGTIVNVVLVIAAMFGYASAGPTSFHAQWAEQATAAIVDVDPTPPLVTEADLATLPQPLAAYVRRCGAVGRPRVTSLLATFHGRIRSGPDQAWMPFTGGQVNTYGPRPQRAFIMDATRFGLPVTVLHQFADARATMRVKLLSAVTLVDAAGPQMDRGETVTVFNDLVVLAPGAIVGAPVRWTTIDTEHVHGVFTNGTQTVSAVLTFDAQHDLVNFRSEDRMRASADGKSFTAQTWSTPLTHSDVAGGQQGQVVGQGQWDAPPPQGLFTYVEYNVDSIAYNERSQVITPGNPGAAAGVEHLGGQAPAGRSR